MSYDLMVFRKEAAPKTRTEFMKWYQNQTEWIEEHGYDDPANTSVELNGWFMEMIQTFPAMNGPFAIEDEDEDNDMVTGYTIGKDVIYTDFRWSVAEQAYNKMLEVAKKHGVGFFDVSSDNGDILFPENGELKAIDDSNKIQHNDIKEARYIDVETTVKHGEEVYKYTVIHKDKPWWKFW
jgi:hypothetical protein